jgi:hypothetical protein
MVVAVVEELVDAELKDVCLAKLLVVYIKNHAKVVVVEEEDHHPTKDQNVIRYLKFLKI